SCLPLYYPLSFLCVRTCSFFFFNDTATTEIYTLSLHDALPISDEAGEAEDDECTIVAQRQRVAPRSGDSRDHEQDRRGDEGAARGQREGPQFRERELPEREVSRPERDHREEQEIGATLTHGTALSKREHDRAGRLIGAYFFFFFFVAFFFTHSPPSG